MVLGHNALWRAAVTLLVVMGVAAAQKNLARPVDVGAGGGGGGGGGTERRVVYNGNNRFVNGSKRFGSSPRNDVRRYGATPAATAAAVNGNGYHPNGMHDGHRMITRALWRIFDALMQKKDHSQLYGRMGFVEEALKKMISVDSQLEGEIDKLKDDMGVCKAELQALMEQTVRFKSIEARLAVLEQDRPELSQQGDQEHSTGGWAAAAYSSCPQPFVKLDNECFYLSQEEMMGWEDARRECGRLAGDLASPRSLESLRSYLTGVDDPPVYLWVGGSLHDDGSWVWSSGSQAGLPVDMSKDTWNEEVPSGSGKCMGLFGQSAYRAYNYDCKEKDYFVCQYFF